MLDTAGIIRSLTDSGVSQEHARAITGALQTTVDHINRKTTSQALTDATEHLALDLVVELVESRYRQARVVFYQWLAGVLIAAFVATAYLLNAHLESAIAQINYAALRGQIVIGDVTETSVAEIEAAKNTVPDHIPDAVVLSAQTRATLQPERLHRVEIDGQGESFQITGIDESGTYCIDAIAETEDFDPVIYLHDSPELSEDSIVEYNDDREDIQSLNSRICKTFATDSNYYLEVRELVDRSGTVLLYVQREDAQ